MNTKHDEKTQALVSEKLRTPRFINPLFRSRLPSIGGECSHFFNVYGKGRGLYSFGIGWPSRNVADKQRSPIDPVLYRIVVKAKRP